MLKTPSVRSPLSSNHSLKKKKQIARDPPPLHPPQPPLSVHYPLLLRAHCLPRWWSTYRSSPLYRCRRSPPLRPPRLLSLSLSRPFHHLCRCLRKRPLDLPSVRLDPLSQPTAPGPAGSEPDLDSILPSFRPESMSEFVNSRGQPATRSTTGGWPFVLFIIGTNLELCFCFLFRQGQWAGRGVRGERRGGGSHGDDGGGGRRQRRSKVGGGGDGERGGVSEELGARELEGGKRKGKKRREESEWNGMSF